MRVSQSGEIVVRNGGGGKSGSPGWQRTRLIEAPAPECSIEMVFLGHVVVQTRGELVKVINIAPLGVQCAGAEGITCAGNNIVWCDCNQSLGDIVLCHNINAAWINDSLRSQRGVGLEERIRQQ